MQDISQNTEAANGGDMIVDVTTQSFMADVIEASQNQLVLLDLWAPWCGPCKQLTPLLEKLTSQAGGAVRLAKMNIDEHPAVAQQLQVQSIPAVFAFKGGQAVDGFMGALPESELTKFIDKHVEGMLGPSPTEALMETGAEALAAGQMDDARACYQAALAHEPDKVAAIAGLAQALLAAGQIDEAEAALQAAPAHDTDPALSAARAQVALTRKIETRKTEPHKTETGDMASGDTAPLLAALDADPNNHQARFDLALTHHAAGQRAAALDALLDIVTRNRSWNDEAARRQLVEFFDAYGAADELVVAARRRLSSLLFS